MKKAYLVSFDVMTRVIVDDEKIPEGNDDAKNTLIIAIAHGKVMKDISSRLIDGTIDILEDTEMPYDPEEEVK